LTQTEERLIREGISGEQLARDTHYKVGQEVRAAIGKIGGTMPEDLPTEESIKKIVRTKKRVVKLK
jgi:DNA-damage-inducible protein D